MPPIFSHVPALVQALPPAEVHFGQPGVYTGAGLTNLPNPTTFTPGYPNPSLVQPPLSVPQQLYDQALPQSVKPGISTSQTATSSATVPAPTIADAQSMDQPAHLAKPDITVAPTQSVPAIMLPAPPSDPIYTNLPTLPTVPKDDVSAPALVQQIRSPEAQLISFD
ncbi:unnamed protein product [Protopolystoma xenopodis]|uniref:Uncharacterized protein n=1 Tax=Protopolystoma xenopodis TaxID=117903 RepID=A0A3S5FFY1_9PLAT|nr:unnamed protein product [Protopolystoma xenopodis]